MRCDSRLVCDAAHLIGASYFETIYCAVACSNPYSTKEQDKATTQWVLDNFVETNIVPRYVEDFLLDLMVGRRVLTDKKGHVVKLPKEVRVWM